MEFFSLIASTLVFRAYVFIFLIFFLVAGFLTIGGRKTGVLFTITWLIAFASEFSSTRIGFPFGEYFYIESTRDKELWISNIPFMDSLSFTFLAYVSYTLALVFLLKPESGSERVLVDREGIRHSLKTLFLAVLFFVFVDVVIDPVALRGDRWFLGKIFGYAHEGIYFGVPISNFLGWAFVGGTSLYLYQRYDGRTEDGKKVWRVPLSRLLLGPALYYLILLFGLSVTFYIGEGLLGTVGILIHLPILVLFLFKVNEHVQSFSALGLERSVSISGSSPYFSDRPIAKGKAGAAKDGSRESDSSQGAVGTRV